MTWTLGTSWYRISNLLLLVDERSDRRKIMSVLCIDQLLEQILES
jgi:hypothetical protein